jgi:hypothetical protein
MNFEWNIDKVNDPANSNIGVVVTLRSPGVALQDTVSPAFARSIADAIYKQADEVDPPAAAPTDAAPAVGASAP